MPVQEIQKEQKVSILYIEMKKKVGIIKRNIATFLIIAMSINTSAAIVSDNDGSAFITKAEFDALKSSFQSQIDTYNQSIDTKIDGAIASYLSGIRLMTEEERSFEFYYSAGVPMMDNNAPLRYSLGYSYGHGLCGNLISQKVTNVARDFIQMRLVNFTGVPAYWNGDNPKPYKKVLIDNLDNSNKYASWVGYGEDCRENLSLGTKFDNRTDQFWNVLTVATESEPILSLNQTAVSTTEYNLNGPTYSGLLSSYGFLFFKSYNNYFIVQSVALRNSQISKQNLCIFSNATCYEFQNNSLVTNLAFANYCAWSNLTTHKRNWVNANSEIIGDEATILDWYIHSLEPAKNACGQAIYSSENPDKLTHTRWLGEAHWNLLYTGPFSGRYWAPLCQGFENTGGWDQWKQIYQKTYDAVADFYSGTLPNAILTTSDGKKHLAITGGFPLFKANKKEKINFDISGTDSTDLPLYVWIKTKPFDLTATPQDETKTDFLTLSGNNGATFDNTAKALKIINNNTTISFEIPETGQSCYLFMKWAKADDAVSAATGGGNIVLPQTAHIVLPDK